MLQDIFSIIEDSDGSERPLSLSKLCVCLNLLCGRGVGNFVKNPCHFLKIKSRFIRNNPVCPNQLVPEFIAQSTDCELSPSHVNMSLGSDCYKLDVFRSLLENILEKKNNVSIAKVLLSNGALLKMDNEQSKKKLSWSAFSFVVSNLFDNNTAHITANVLCHDSSLKEQINQLNINKSKELPFLSQQFHCNKKTTILVIIF